MSGLEKKPNKWVAGLKGWMESTDERVSKTQKRYAFLRRIFYISFSEYFLIFYVGSMELGWPNIYNAWNIKIVFCILFI